MVKKLLLTKNNFITYISLYIILFILILLYFANNFYYKEHFNFNLKYFRCDTKKLGIITNEIFTENNITKDNFDWSIYVPCGYNNIERELLTIKITNLNNKYIFGINGCDSIVSKNISTGAV